MFFCHVCKEHVAEENSKDHKESPEHSEARQHAKTTCSLCKEEFLLREKEEHKQSEAHRKMLKNIFCGFCQEDVSRDAWEDHQKTDQHLEAKQNTKSTCEVCREEFLPRDKEEHLESEAHRRAVAENQKVVNCAACNVKVARKDWKQHQTTPKHLEALKKQRITCDLCQKEFLRVDKEAHKECEEHKSAVKTKLHQEAKKRKDETVKECTVCKQKFVPRKWNEHKNSPSHLTALQQLEEKKEGKVETAGRKNEERAKPEKYALRPGSEENQSYVNTLAVFVAVRFALYTKKDFKLSINNEEWKGFGDIVFEFPNCGGKTKVMALRCKKTETRDLYNSVVLSAETGHLSLKVNYELMKKLEEKADVTFVLHTASSLMMESRELSYDDLNHWEEEGRRTWKNKKIEVATYRSKKKDFFNGTNDVDNVVSFVNEELGTTLKKFRMYFNQKQQPELKSSITTMIENVFNTRANISGDLVRFVEKKLKTSKAGKKNQTAHKMTREDFLTKISELLLVPFMTKPARGRCAKLELWNELTQQFDIVLVKNSEDIAEKIYSPINHILGEEMEFVLEASRVTVKKVKDETLRWKVYDIDNDASLEFLYLTLWKNGFAPMVLTVNSEKELEVVYTVVTFLKSKDHSLKFVVITDLSCDYHPRSINVFQNLSHLPVFELFWKILDEEVNLLDLTVSLRVIYDYNEDFLKKVTSDVLLNVFFKMYNFVDAVDIPLTKEILEDVIILGDDHLERVRTCLDGQGNVEDVSFLVTVKGEVKRIQVPPNLFMPIK